MSLSLNLEDSLSSLRKSARISMIATCHSSTTYTFSHFSVCMSQAIGTLAVIASQEVMAFALLSNSLTIAIVILHFGI